MDIHGKLDTVLFIVKAALWFIQNPTTCIRLVAGGLGLAIKIAVPYCTGRG